MQIPQKKKGSPEKERKESGLVSQKGLVGGLIMMKEVKKRLQVQATADANERTRMSLRKSCLEGNKPGGGSINNLAQEWRASPWFEVLA